MMRSASNIAGFMRLYNHRPVSKILVLTRSINNDREPYGANSPITNATVMRTESETPRKKNVNKSPCLHSFFFRGVSDSAHDRCVCNGWIWQLMLSDIWIMDGKLLQTMCVLSQVFIVVMYIVRHYMYLCFDMLDQLFRSGYWTSVLVDMDGGSLWKY